VAAASRRWSAATDIISYRSSSSSNNTTHTYTVDSFSTAAYPVLLENELLFMSADSFYWLKKIDRTG
jgi:hypothetical protein